MKLDVFRRAVLASNLMQFEIRVVLPQLHANKLFAGPVLCLSSGAPSGELWL
jgi:hypothetical protein